MTAENRTFTVKRSNRGSGTASDLRRYAHRQADVYRPHVPFVPVPSPVPRPRPGASERQFFRFNLQRIFGQATIALLPNPVGIDSGRLPGAAARATWVNIAREISKWLLEWQPRVSPSRRKAAPHGLHRKASEVRIGNGISTALSITA